MRNRNGDSMMKPRAAAQAMEAAGFQRVRVLHGSTYRDNSTVIIAPTRGMVHHRVVAAWQSLIPFMNQKRAFLFCVGDEVGVAYNRMIESILKDAELSTWKYVLTLEDDNLPPPDAHVRLLESIEQFKLDAVSGIYFTKGDVTMPMAYGDPFRHQESGQLDFRPLDIRPAMDGANVLEVNGIAMGCALWRMELFRQIEAPWFVTVNEWLADKGTVCFTQDLNFCQRAKAKGKRFAVDMRVRVGHLDVRTGIVY